MFIKCSLKVLEKILKCANNIGHLRRLCLMKNPFMPSLKASASAKIIFDFCGAVALFVILFGGLHLSVLF